MFVRSGGIENIIIISLYTWKNIIVWTKWLRELEIDLRNF